MDTRELPRNIEAEKTAVSLALASRDWQPKLQARGFRPEWLHAPHRQIWAEVATEWERTPADDFAFSPSVLMARLIAEKKLDDLGGPATLLGLVDHLPPITHDDMADHVAALLRDAWQRRQAIALAAALTNSAYGAGLEFADELAGAIASLGMLGQGTPLSKLRNGADVLNEVIAELEAGIEAGADGAPQDVTGLPTDIPEINEKVGGLVPGFWLIGAETSGGKTVLAMQLARCVLRAGSRALVFPLEMGDRQVMRRILAAEARVPLQRIRRPNMMLEMDMLNVSSRGGLWNPDKLTICTDRDVTIQEVRAIARAEHAKDPLGVVVLDYLQLCSAGNFRRDANREQEVSEIGKQCALMAGELGIPVIAPTQLTDDGKVRESRALKHHSAVYLVIEEDSILCAKNRDGERDWSMPYKLTGDIQTFEKHHGQDH